MPQAPQEIIRIKRDGHELSRENIESFFGGFLRDEVADYQVSAMLMALLLKGMSRDETVALTELSRDSGRVFSWSHPKHLVVDKHSTGGIGDKTSMIILPLAVLAGLKVPMMAGRGLGHTGGTLDKLESIPGMQVFLEADAVQKQVTEVGGVFMGQTANIAALDRRLYSLRDVTATVESIPLITASILSKKLAEGLGSLVLDVKCGSGAFLKDPKDARLLADNLVNVGKACGLKTRALITDMNSPLGDTAGNSLEICECIDVLQGRGPADTRELSLALTEEMVASAFPERAPDEIRAELEHFLDSGQAYEMFCRVAKAQGANTAALEKNGQGLAKAKYIKAIAAVEKGQICNIDVRALGIAVLQLGGGRLKVTDQIDPAVGLSQLKRVGHKVEPGEPLLLVHANDEARGRQATETILRAIEIGSNPSVTPLISERVM